MSAGPPKVMVYKVVGPPEAPPGLITLDEFKDWLKTAGKLTTQNAEQVARLLQRRGSITVHSARLSYQAHYAGLRGSGPDP